MFARYRPSTEIREGPAQELLQRLEVLGDESLVKSKPAAQAALGTVDRPRMRLSELPEAYSPLRQIGFSARRRIKFENSNSPSSVPCVI